MQINSSITSAESFAIRAQRSEARRVALWLIVLIGMLVLTLGRRGAGGLVMSSDRMFFPYAGVLVVGIFCEVILLLVLRPANRGGYLLPAWLWRASAIFDLCVASSLLVIAGFFSPRGPAAALSEPPLLLLPLVVLMSVLRLRPKFTLFAGLAAALVDLLLAIRTLHLTHALPETVPVYLAYSGILVLTAIIGMAVSREMRGHVLDAAEEATAHERANQEVYRMNHDLEIARKIQQGLLPKRTPRLNGFDIAGMNRPAEQTGGDYYDWQELPDGRLAVVLADVSGHGIGAALVMAVCRAYARSTAPLTPDPASLLTRINALIKDDLPSERFITLALCLLDRDGTAQLISAGHGPTLLYRARTQTITDFNGDGVPLGVLADEKYGPSTSIALNEGDVIVMLTDGFFEYARSDDEQQFGLPRLRESVCAAASADAAAILRSLDESVRTFSNGSPQQDDMTAIVIKRMARAKVSSAAT